MHLAFSDDAVLNEHLGLRKRWLPAVMMFRLANRPPGGSGAEAATFRRPASTRSGALVWIVRCPGRWMSNRADA